MADASETFRVTAILAAHNEGDVIAPVVEHLVAQGVGVYLIDHRSTDDTVERAEPFLGRGLIAIERFEGDDAHPWRSVLERKEQLARELDAHWFLHHDADEIRESPWADLTLAEAIRRVDENGYDAIDFEVFDFPPVDESYEPGGDLVAAFPYYERARDFDKVQIKGWKKTGGPLDLVSSGGHEAVFPGRRVFPLRFILRHYPFRGQAHGERKVFEERRPRLVAAERESEGWHRQYDDVRPGHRFVRDPAGLRRWDGEAVRLHLVLHHRGTEGEERAGHDLASCRRTLAVTSRELDRKNREVEDLHRRLDRANHEREALGRRLEEVLESRSWRWTAPLRRVLRPRERRRR